MTERPILFSGEMVRAILEGRKTQTRRIMKIQPPDEHHRISTLAETTDRSRRKFEGQHHWVIFDDEKKSLAADQDKYFKSPFGYVGDRLWVRERYWADRSTKQFRWYMNDIFDLDKIKENVRLIPSIHMPRRLSRLDLEIVSLRVERLQDISEEDAKAEGTSIALAEQMSQCASGDILRGYRAAFGELWERINGAESWNKNPWVWVIEFKKM